MRSQKKGQTGAVATGIGVFLTLLALGILLSVGLEVVDQIQDSQTPNTAGCNSTDTSGCGHDWNVSEDVLSGGENFSDQMPTVFLIAAVGILISILLGAFAFIRLRG